MKREVRDIFYSIAPKNEYIQSGAGSINLLLTAPHGGGMRPVSIPKRKYGKMKMDTYSRRLTRKLLELYDYMPYYVIADIHRSRVDLNRDMDVATQGNEKAEKIWYDWNNIIEQYKRDILIKNKKALYIDIHSKGEDDYFELGYNLSAYSYRRVFANELIKGSTLDSLEHYLKHMLFGSNSLEYNLKSCGYKVLYPQGDEEYFNGGRDIETFSGNGLGGIQVEVPVSVLKKDLDGVAICLYNAIEIFRERFVNGNSQV